MRPSPTRVRLGLLAALTALTALVSMGTASAATELSGNWAPFTRCPVDAPAMLAADGKIDTALCLSSHSAAGSIKLGSSVVPTGASDLQLGVVTHPGGTSTLISPPGGALIADSAQLPGGLLGLMCPSDIPVVSSICKQITNVSLNRVTATIESVNSPSDFKLIAGTTTGQQIIALPVRIHLENTFLGSNCYIGSTSNPIVLRPQNLTKPTIATQRFDADGTPNTAGVATRLALIGADQSDSTYAVPGASGCGLGLLDWAVNLKTSLPSAAGNNNVVLNSASTYLGGVNGPAAVAPNDGALLSQYWHTAAQ
ncbi:hypothetical protein [Streptomyces sp. NPDC050738]|uniref:hypothetical protein n=1 Tax=Streptomyces sp. NPDC050738 TaxID=3154744 RepID=UPI0034325B79